MSDLPPFQPEDYLCTTCGGFKQLPLHYFFPPRWRRWCICDYEPLFDFFMQAHEYSQPEPDPETFIDFLNSFRDGEGKRSA